MGRFAYPQSLSQTPAGRIGLSSTPNEPVYICVACWTRSPDLQALAPRGHAGGIFGTTRIGHPVLLL